MAVVDVVVDMMVVWPMARPYKIRMKERSEMGTSTIECETKPRTNIQQGGASLGT